MKNARALVMAIIVWLLLAPAAHAAMLYDIVINDPDLSGSGQIDFMGDLSTDGFFPLQASDIAAFSFTFNIPAPHNATVLYGLTDITSFQAYGVVGGDLSSVQFELVVAQGSGGCPVAGGGASCSLNFGTGNTATFTLPFAGGGLFFPSIPYTVTAVPIPSATLLFGTGLICVIGWNYRKTRS